MDEAARIREEIHNRISHILQRTQSAYWHLSTSIRDFASLDKSSSSLRTIDRARCYHIGCDSTRSQLDCNLRGERVHCKFRCRAVSDKLRAGVTCCRADEDDAAAYKEKVNAFGFGIEGRKDVLDPLFFFADSNRYGIVAFTVLYDPITSISTTALKAFVES